MWNIHSILYFVYFLSNLALFNGSDISFYLKSGFDRLHYHIWRKHIEYFTVLYIFWKCIWNHVPRIFIRLKACSEKHTFNLCFVDFVTKLCHFSPLRCGFSCQKWSWQTLSFAVHYKFVELSKFVCQQLMSGNVLTVVEICT